MATLKKLWFFLVLSLIIASALIFLFPRPQIYLFVLFLGTICVGVMYMYMSWITRPFLSHDFLLVSSLGVGGYLLGILYEMFLYMNAPSSYRFLYPLHFLLSLWLSVWVVFAVFFVQKRLKRPWILGLVWAVALGGLWFMVNRHGAVLVPWWNSVISSSHGVWLPVLYALVNVVAIVLVVVFRHKMISTLYTALFLWLVFRGIGGGFWFVASQNLETPLWLQYILTIEWIGLLFGLDGAVYSGVHYPFHKLNRQIHILSEEKALSMRVDRITRTLNSEAFQDLLYYEVLRQKRQRSDLSLLSIDAIIDIKASTAYNCPDSVLGLLASSFRANLRAHDVISHWGGGRFVILLMDTDIVGCCAVGRKIRDVVAMSEYLCGQDMAHVTLRIGAAVYISGMTVKEFLSLAFTNLAEAKKTGSQDVVSEAIFDYPEKP